MKEIVDFLLRLERNNDREWFNAHKNEYKAVQARFDEFTAELIAGIAQFDGSVAGLTPKECTYRIYRDTRFSNDKTPYKTHIGAYVCPGGKKSGNAGYYLHIEPAKEGMIGGSAVIAGLYMPDAAVLRSIREDIMYNNEEFTSTLKKAEAKGFALNEMDKLKRIPLGYPADSPYAEYLKLKNFDVDMHVDNDYILAPNLLERVIEDFSATADFVRHLNRAVAYAREEN